MARMTYCSNCGKPKRKTGLRCERCRLYYVAHKREWVPPQPKPPVPPRVELYRKGRCIDTVAANDEEAAEVLIRRMDIAEQRGLPVAAIVPVLRTR